MHSNPCFGRLPARVPAFDDSGIDTLVRCRIAEAQLPVILTASHGGNSSDSDQSSRFSPRPENHPGVSILQDFATAPLLEEIDQRILEMTGQVKHFY